jgi:hypothetical protein
MTNMSYCRFENTLADLRDCYEQIESLLEGDPETEQVTSDRERKARIALIELCFDVVARFEDEGVEADDNDLQGAIRDAVEQADEVCSVIRHDLAEEAEAKPV